MIGIKLASFNFLLGQLDVFKHGLPGLQEAFESFGFGRTSIMTVGVPGKWIKKEIPIFLKKLNGGSRKGMTRLYSILAR